MHAAFFDHISLASTGHLIATLLAIFGLAAHAKSEGFNRTRERLIAWLTPSLLALVCSLLSIWLYNQPDFGSPEALLQLGAHYAPRTNAAEGWRFLTSLFVHDELGISLIDALALLWIGWHLSREIGTISFLISLATCQIAACFMASEIDLQTLYYGSGAAIVGISAMSLTLQRWKFLKSRDVVALGAILFHTGFTLLAALEGSVVDIEAIGAAGCTGAALGVITLAFRRACERRPPQAVRIAHVLGCCLLAICLGVASQNLKAPEDVIGALQSARSKRAQLTARLSDLESARAAGLISAGQFAEKIETDVQKPIDNVSDEIEVLVLSRKTHAKWLDAERRDGAVKSLGLEIVSTVYRAKEQLLTAREKIAAKESSVELETFWKQTFPLLSRQVNALHELSANSKAQKVVALARTAAIRDLTDLETAATDLEIMQAELYLSDLRAFSLGLDERKPASGQTDSNTDWSAVAADIASHKERLALIASRIRQPSERLQGLLGHFDKAHEALTLDPTAGVPAK